LGRLCACIRNRLLVSHRFEFFGNFGAISSHFYLRIYESRNIAVIGWLNFVMSAIPCSQPDCTFWGIPDTFRSAARLRSTSPGTLFSWYRRSHTYPVSRSIPYLSQLCHRPLALFILKNKPQSLFHSTARSPWHAFVFNSRLPSLTVSGNAPGLICQASARSIPICPPTPAYPFC
jgi:hypothetical protein